MALCVRSRLRLGCNHYHGYWVTNMSKDIEDSIATHQRLANKALARTKQADTTEAKRRAFYVYRTNKRKIQQLQQLLQDKEELDKL